MKTVKQFVKCFYSIMRIVSLPLLLILEPLGYKPYVAIATVTTLLAFLFWDFGPQLCGRAIALVVVFFGVLLACLFGLWGDEFEKDRKAIG